MRLLLSLTLSGDFFIVDILCFRYELIYMRLLWFTISLTKSGNQTHWDSGRMRQRWMEGGSAMHLLWIYRKLSRSWLWYMRKWERESRSWVIWWIECLVVCLCMSRCHWEYDVLMLCTNVYDENYVQMRALVFPSFRLFIFSFIFVVFVAGFFCCCYGGGGGWYYIGTRNHTFNRGFVLRRVNERRYKKRNMEEKRMKQINVCLGPRLQ